MKTGLIVTCSSTISDELISKIVLAEYDAEWDDENLNWFFPEIKSNYDSLEIALQELFNKHNINARFEGIF